MNKNRSFDEQYNHLLLNKDKVKLNPYWVLGFVDAEGTFGSLITKSSPALTHSVKDGERVKGEKRLEKIVTRSRFSISQSTHDVFILQHIKNFFNAGYLDPKETEIDTLALAPRLRARGRGLKNVKIVLFTIIPLPKALYLFSIIILC
uniref:LAGLIDADG homing endonuclease n=1 Tax=Termitomyces sp. TaxID=1916073 RepID=A0A386TYM4_9AGAR|nr:LAGLIDADG homing endonuclease [Termitomyces sp.]AYE93261.1 LAGLIDADG homing endonuclease [Termitomyces sp.]